jgi:hypothetical protein
MLRKALTCDVLQTPFIVASVVNQLVENLAFTYVVAVVLDLESRIP